MPNEIKNALKASTSHVTTNHTMSRQLPVAGSSTVSVMVWTISGIVLASCGGGGGGGAGGSGLSVSGSGSNGDGGGGGSSASASASGPSGNIARVVDGPVEGAAVYFDIDGDGEVSDSERAAQKQNGDPNGDPMYITDANGYVNAPIEYEGHFFIANVDNATDTATGDTLSGEYQSLSTGGIATPITDLIADRMRESNADAQGVLDDIFGADGLVTVADILDAENYKILNLGDEAEKPTLPSGPTSEEQEEYDLTLAKYKTSVIMEVSLALSEIDKDGEFANLESPAARVDALKQIVDDGPDSNNNDTAALEERISDRVAAGREILGRKPLAQPDSSVSPIDEDSVFRFPQGSEDIFGFTDTGGNSDDAAASRFTGIYVKSSVDFSQDGDAHTVNLLYNGSALSGHEVAGSDNPPDNLPPETGFYYVSSENLSRLSINPSRDNSGTLEVEYYVFDGEQWSDKASLEITVSPVDDPATAVAVGAQDLTAIDENTDLTGGMKVADLDVTDADGAPHGLVVGGTNAGFFEIRNRELWLVLDEGATLDYETTPTLTVHVEVAGANPAVRTGDITVRVNNVNDNLPIIEQLGSQIPLNEGTFPNTPTNTGYRYTASDADGGTSRLTLSGDPRERFQIDTNGNLQIKANSEFDYENPDDSSITLTITAADSGVGPGSPAVTDTETVIITFGDVNEAPTATPRAGISTADNVSYVLEAVDFGFRDVDADDLDGQFHSVIITSLPGQGQGTLELNSNPVSINTSITLTDINNGRLIYMPSTVQEGGQPYNAAIGYRVLDDGDADGANKLSSATEILVIAVEQNQSATGVAVGTRFLTAIDENTNLTAGIKVADLTVTDIDGPPHRLEGRGDNTGFFEIRNEDELWLVVDTGETLDYETTPALAVQVGVSGAPDITPVNITVAVNNVNDNAPVISLEGGQNQVQNPLDEGIFPNVPTDTGYSYTASDADGGTSTLRVSGDAQDRFVIDADGNLQIKAGAEFDYETSADRAIMLTITATDSGAGSGNPPTAATHEVTITFGDVNEAPPEQPPLEDNIDSGDAHFSIFSDGRQAISAETGAVLTATEVTPDPDIDAAVYSYQWYHIGAGTSGADDDIAGATSRSYTVADTDEGKRIGVRVRYAENSFQSDGTTPTGTETIAAELPPIVDFTKIRDISSEVRYSNSGPFALVASISTKETGDHLILYEIRSNSRSVFDTTNPHRATITSPETGSVYVYEISGVDKDSFMLVQNGSNIYIVSRTGFNYENPTDSDQDNNYEITLTNSPRFVPPISYALTITNDTSEAQVKVATASIIETSSSIKFTSLEDAVRAYSGIDDALLGVSATFGGAVVNGANPHRATVTFEVAGQDDIVFTYELSGDDVNDVRLVQDGNDVSLITVTGLDYENPADEDEMNTYSVVETITTISPNVPSRYRDVSTTYTLSVTDDISEASIEVYENAPLYKPMEIDSVDLQGYQLTEGYVDNTLFTIDAIGQIWWKAAPDYEAPRDGDGDNLYEIELYRTNSTGQTHRVQVDIRVNDLGTNIAPGEEYKPDIRITPDNIPDEHLPRDFVQHLITGRHVWQMPVTGPLIITYSIDPSSAGNDKLLSILDEVLLSYEQAANLKFIEVNPRDPDEYNDYVPQIKVMIVGGTTVSSFRRLFDIPEDGLVGISSNHVNQRVITHELGHALGLAHPFEETAGWPGDRDYNQSTLSVMSYNRNVIALQPADIEALQFLYGAPGTDFMGAERFAELRGDRNGFARKFIVEPQILTEIDANTDLTAGIKVAEFAPSGFGTIEIVGNHTEFFDLRIKTPGNVTMELWLKLEEGESLENITALEVYVRIAEKHAVRTEDITITVNNVGSSGAMGSSDRTSGVVGDADQIKINEAVDEGQSVIANLVDLDLGAIDLTEITIGGDDRDQVQIRQTQNGGVLEFVSAPDFEAPEDSDEDNVYEITLYDDLTSIEVDITVIDIPEL